MLMRYLWDRVEGIYAQLENIWDYRGVWWIESSQPLKLYIDRSEVEHWNHGGQEKELQLSVPRARNREIKNGLKVGLYLDWIPALPLTNYMASAPLLNLSNSAFSSVPWGQFYIHCKVVETYSTCHPVIAQKRMVIVQHTLTLVCSIPTPPSPSVHVCAFIFW